ncbi:putative ABC transporter permease YknZ [Novipirellula aureliae]|uniref:Putative ABC transporter permease YknZ n=1 Tax=Novipirellula aureliae TaxID=2527966 RepID=A0A5C6DG32_9BACT|nr:ABC transporter permease [Novipirellula aureliae]TWU35750.1 putative ABC transporter permease YknZ [Novipirellula aureliae]
MTNLRLLAKLVISQTRLHPGRAIITTLGIIASTCAVVWVVSGYDALVSQFDENAGKYLGRYDALVIPKASGPPGSPTPTIDESLIATLEQDAGVLEVNPISNSRVSAARVGGSSDGDESESSLGLLIGDRPPVNGAPPIGPTMVSTPATEEPTTLIAGQWLSDTNRSLGFQPETPSTQAKGRSHESAFEAVVGEDVAKEMKLSVGDELRVTTFGNQVQLRVIGIVEQAPEAPSLRPSGRGRGPSPQSGEKRKAPGGKPSAPTTPSIGLPSGFTQGIATSAIYVRPSVAAIINGYPTKPQTLQIAIRDTVTIEQFRNVWQDKLAANHPPLQLVDFSAVRSGLEASGSVSSQQSQAWAATGMASLAAIFIIFSTLSMGVSERAREFAMLRAIALTRTQIAGIIAIESLLLASVGWLGGLAAGWFLVLLGSQLLPSLFVSGAVLGWGCVALTGLTVFVGAIGAAVLPAWRAMRIQPLEAMTSGTGFQPVNESKSQAGSLYDESRSQAGSLCHGSKSQAGSLCHGSKSQAGSLYDESRSQAGSLCYGSRSQAGSLCYDGKSQAGRLRYALVGLLLVASTPAIVFLLPMSDAWRKWCYSFVTYPMLLLGILMLAPMIVMICERAFAPVVTGLLRLDQRMIKTQLSSNLWRSVGATLALSVGLGLYTSTQIWGYSMLVPFTPGDWLPDALVAFHPIGLEKDDEQRIRQVDGVNPDQVMALAIEQAKFDWGDAGPPERLKMGGDNGIVCGIDPVQAFGGKSPMLPVTFVAGDRETAIKSLSDGDACVIAEDFSMATGLGVGDSVTFIPPAAGDQRVTYRIAAVVSLPGWQWVTKFSGVRRHFVRTGTLLFASRKDVRTDFALPHTEFFWLNFRGTGFQPVNPTNPQAGSLAHIEAAFQSIAERHAGKTFTADGVGEVNAYRPFARMTATEDVKKAIKIRADDMIWGMSYLPLITLVVMSLAVVNTIIASVRSRTWELGVMRSIGVTRSQLVRLVIAETILIAVAACVLSLSFGLIAGWCGVGMAKFGGWFAGPPTFLIPWRHLAFGFTLTLTLCLLAGIWPAIKIGRAEPLELLQAGRSVQ